MAEHAGQEDGAEELRAFLAARDVACPGCGYNLRGLVGGVCPECNRGITLRVGLSEPRQGAFVAGLVGISLSLGFCAMVLVYFGVVSILVHPGDPPPLSIVLPVAIGTVIGGLLLWVWLARRRRLMRLESARRRWAWAALATAAAFACTVWFIANGG